ncbi:tripartite tricarboxylate transporter substrate binding protein [Aquabacter sp. L1I39]|uniref:tripartite tricarboxylate transporter substrate binding protein n=1 Tax=Aquabacter sp. L1I39 TaxID=2820278 RepID=UPI001ADD52B1|nr:tripartite tricarboxylate transporter substrate binding protein [Aquabacter sp. L1I39]QTL04087.1 tripartite tricarboxylate transporter substrate binding protein [Aquabacter sp. L1I39]
MDRRHLLLSTLAGATALLAAPFMGSLPAQADAYPSRPIHLVVGYAAGGSTDQIARIVGQKLSEELGQPVVIDNKPGAGATIASDFVAKSAPDGYTLFMSTIANTINTTLYRRLPFDFERDFAPVSLVATVPNVLVVNPSVPATTVQEFIALAKKNPEKIYFASSGSGSSIHLSGELFNMVAGVKLTHVPYKGSAPAVVDLMSGQVQAMFDNLSSSLPYIKAGKLRALAVTSATRSPAAPDIPTMAEAGLPDCEVLSWFALVAPAKTPQPIIDKLNAAVVKLLADPSTKQQFDNIGADPASSTPAALAKLISSETAKWAKVVKTSGAEVN